MNNEKIYAMAFQSIPDIGAKTIISLKRHFTDLETAWYSSYDELMTCSQLSQDICKKVIQFKSSYDCDYEYERLLKHNINIVTIWDDDYPMLLKNTFNPPALLFYKGILGSYPKTMAIVGSRKATSYGKNIATKFAEELSNQTITIVSGGARGIDTYAHIGALKGISPTIAVVANGLDIIYPKENQHLFEKILSNNGLVISEYPLGMQPLPGNFPARNRIISGLSKGVLVIEAAFRSGSLITADFALEEGRDVFAIPGSIYSTYSAGTNHLLKQGACVTTSIEDIMEGLNWNIQESTKEKIKLTLEAAALLELIPSDTTISQESLVIQSQLLPQKLAELLLQLELSDLIRNEGRNHFTRCDQ